MFKKKVHGLILTHKAFGRFLALWAFFIGDFLAPWVFLTPIHMGQSLALLVESN